MRKESEEYQKWRRLGETLSLNRLLMGPSGRRGQGEAWQWACAARRIGNAPQGDQDNMNIKADVNTAFTAFRGLLIRAVSRIAPPKDVEDIVQETYVRACQAEKKQDIKYPRAFLLKIARNLALDYVKSAAFRYSDSVDEAELDDLLSAGQEWDTTHAQVVAEEEFALFCEAVRHLPDQCRRAFVLKKVYGYSQKEIARFMGIAEKTVEKHIAYGMKRCTYFLSQPPHRAHVRQARVRNTEAKS